MNLFGNKGNIIGESAPDTWMEGDIYLDDGYELGLTNNEIRITDIDG